MGNGVVLRGLSAFAVISRISSLTSPDGGSYHNSVAEIMFVPSLSLNSRAIIHVYKQGMMTGMGFALSVREEQLTVDCFPQTTRRGAVIAFSLNRSTFDLLLLTFPPRG